MESSDAEMGVVNCGVGTIVWVRRRNGSWWPGKILGPDELSASHLMSPRSGTPVKLLGREDASVDWYNLEKSKRVKPFRCGEFDDCIERAEASQGMPPKKREKYARREDAILHALELEKQVLEKKYGKSNGGLSTKLPGKETTPEHISNVDEKRKLQSRSGSHVNVDDKRPDVHSSFRDLIPPFKHKLAASNGETKKLLEKRKRAQEGNNNNNNSSNMEESVGKRRDRHRPLVQVLQSTHPLQSKPDEQREVANGPGMTAHHRDTLPSPDHLEVEAEVEVPAPPVALSEDNTTGSNEDTETDSSGTESLISDTYDAAMAALSDEGEDMEFIPKAFGRCEGKGAAESMSDEESGGAPGDSLVSKWQQKGKRNRLRKRNSDSDSRQWMMGFQGEDSAEARLDMGLKGDGCRMLMDVEVGVQSGYQREHVPMISLMSRLNDKAIVGHPIPVEALEDGSSLSEMEILGGYDLQPWRTARRTAKSRPPHLSTSEAEAEAYYDEDGKTSVNRSSKGKKPQRRTTSACTSQKIRTLSSIGGPQQQQQQQSVDLKAEVEQGEGIGTMMMKPESLPTAVACIPVKLVFSRLHEELLAPRHQ